MLILQSVYWGTTHTPKNYVNQVLNRAINHYNSALTTAYSRIATLETKVTCLQRELIRLPKGNITSKAKVPEQPIFADSENKMQLHDWLNQIALYCLASGIIADDQKTIVIINLITSRCSIHRLLFSLTFL